MSPAPIEQSSTSPVVSEKCGRFENLRSVRWRIDLGILPSSPSIDDLRRVAADSRRRYAGLRRRLLVDPHLRKDISNSHVLVMDNPLSQNPDSTWGRFFRNAELEKMVDQDLSRLYPEQGSYFQTHGCQGLLRRILLLWCLIHPECGYRQGMHELLAPLLYVLHVDLERLSQVRKEHEDHFTDKFDGLSFHENDLTYNFDFKKFLDSMEDDIGSHGNPAKFRSLDELDHEIQTIVLLSDAYGAEGELGIVLSEKFMEHDAYCMFDSLMSGAHGSVAMADFFSPSVSDCTNLPPVIEASAAFYHLLSVVDSSLHSHLVELGVEPQYFALRWLRVLFGREFSIGDLLLVWDEIFASDNIKLNKCAENYAGSNFGILSSPRGALIAAIAVSMMLYLRSSLLATENATSCLQRLLNFPENINLQKIIEKAKSLQSLGLDANISSLFSPFGWAYNHSKLVKVRGHSLSSDSISPRTPLTVIPDSYWEEKWKVLHEAEELRQSSSGKQNPGWKKGWSEKVKLSLSRTESDPSPAKIDTDKKEPRASGRRNLLEDLSCELDLEKDIEKTGCCEVSDQKSHASVEEVEREDSVSKDFTCSSDERCLSEHTGSEEDASIFYDPASPVSGANDHENDSEKSSLASNLSLDENEGHPQSIPEDTPLPVSHPPDDVSQNSPSKNDSTVKSMTGLKEWRLHFGKSLWFWKFGWKAVGEKTSEKEVGALKTTETANAEGDQINRIGSSTADSSRYSFTCSKGDALDQNVMVTLKNLGQSMLEHIQIIESVFQQDRGLENFSKNVLVGKGQATAMTALQELRKISNLLSEM